MLLDPSGRGATARQLTLAGLAMLTAFAVVLAALALRYTGYFEEKVAVSADLTSTGDGLPQRADVKFRGMVVGRVEDVEVVAKGQRQRVEIYLEPVAAQTIPANVTARVIPNNIFGVSAIELVDNGRSGAVLTEGASIAEDTSTETMQLQTTLTVLRDVLDNIQPAKLGRVLATLAAALDPAARVPGSTIERLDRWITEVRTIPGIGELLGDLGAATTALSQSAPELVGVLTESVTAAQTLTERRSNLVALLANASGAIDSVNSLFARNPNAAKDLVPGLGQLFGGLAEDPDAIPYTARNLNQSLGALASVFTWGPKKQMVWKMDVSFTPFQQYTAEDCPRYGDLTGPRCGGPSVPTEAPEQVYPEQMRPGWLDAAGPAPTVVVPGLPGTDAGATIPGVAGIPGVTAPGLPSIPGLPVIPGLPTIPGLTAPAADVEDPAVEDPAQDPTATAPAAATTMRPIASGRGYAAVAAVVGGRPTAAQLLLLTPVLAGGSVTMYEMDGGA